MRSPALPAGSVFMSSGLAWITRAVPPPVYSECASEPRFTPLVDDGGLGIALLVGREIEHVARVRALGILKPVLLGLGIEMGTGGLEIRPIAFGVLVEVNGVFAGREPFEIELERDARPGGLDVDGSNILAAASLILTVMPFALALPVAGTSANRKKKEHGFAHEAAELSADSRSSGRKRCRQAGYPIA
jgi:hypothetical protein